MKEEFSTFFEKRESLLRRLPAAKENYARFAKLLEFQWQKNQTELNIFSRKMSAGELFEKHFLDSLLALDLWPKGPKKVADFGSGGGFPALFLAIERPEQVFYLYEKSEKKQKFLQQAKSFLALKNVEIRGSIDDPKDMDLITARAFKPIQEILRLSPSHLKKGGTYLLYKGTMDRIQEELHGLHVGNLEIIALNTLGLDMQRHMVKIES
tara:strand:+ start:17244 stop:17873 length:630 start_codon:yes stop_codon:yes gene_type:complete